MTKEIKEEIVSDLIEILSLFDIPESKMIEEIARDELTSKDLNNIGYPLLFFDILPKNAFSGGIDYVGNDYRYNEEIIIILSLESRDERFEFSKLFYFLSNLQETTDYFRKTNRQIKRKIKDVIDLYDGSTYFDNKRYFKTVIQFSYIYEFLLEKTIWLGGNNGYWKKRFEYN